jgi:hypothetical protein
VKSEIPIIADKELFRLWYEFYQLALQSADAKIQRSLKKSATFYEDWHGADGLHFDDWWKTHRKLFHDENTVRLLDAKEKQQQDNIYLVVPSGKSQADLVDEFKKLLEKELPKISRRRKLPPAHRFAPTEIQGVKRDSLRMMLDLQKSIFSKSELKGVALRERVMKFFSSERYKRKRNMIPMTFAIDASNRNNDHAAEADRNIRRYRQKANALLLNVASGKFPGKY